MTEEIKIPTGFILVPKGGRPKKTERDMAVLIARVIKKGELNKVYLANDWVIGEFGLNDAGHVRSCLKKAKEHLPDKFLTVDFGESAILMGVQISEGGMTVIEKGSSAWFWAKGEKEATEVKANETIVTKVKWDEWGTLNKV